MRFLIDMNLTPRWVPCLNAQGWDAVHWSSVGQATAKDREICDYGRGLGFILLTNDLDFPQILAHTKEGGPSVVLLRGEPLTPEERGAALVQAIRSCSDDLIRGAILTLDWTDRPRARLLPLK
jgi:predicted nuclease of predicted toxin-antitoxin system